MDRPRYSQGFGDQSSVGSTCTPATAPMDDLGDRFVACFVAAMDDAELPADPELRGALRAYMRWAVDNVLQYAPIDAVVPTGAAMPRWDWDGLEA